MRNQQTLLSRPLRRVIWFTILAAQFFYVILILSGLLPAAAEPLARPYLVPVFAAFAAAFGFAAQMLWVRSGGAGERVARSQTGSAQAPAYYHIMVWALDEAVGVMALTLAVLGYGAGVWGSFAAAGIVLTLVHYPG